MKKKYSILKLIFLIIVAILVISCKKEDGINNTITDIEGNVYYIITIGTQVWMAENLKTTKYRNGDPIPNISDSMSWTKLTKGAYCDYNNSPDTSKTYGKLYNWYAVNDSRNIAPTDWHIPTDADWTILINYLGGGNVAGGKLKAASTLYWNTPNTGASNRSGFTAFPGGYRDELGVYYNLGKGALFWSATESNLDSAYHRFISYDLDDVIRNQYYKKSGFSVRCLRD